MNFFSVLFPPSKTNHDNARETENQIERDRKCATIIYAHEKTLSVVISFFFHLLHNLQRCCSFYGRYSRVSFNCRHKELRKKNLCLTIAFV